MLRSDAVKNDTLYKCYCKIEADYEKKWEKKDFSMIGLNTFILFKILVKTNKFI